MTSEYSEWDRKFQKMDMDFRTSIRLSQPFYESRETAETAFACHQIELKKVNDLISRKIRDGVRKRQVEQRPPMRFPSEERVSLYQLGNSKRPFFSTFRHPCNRLYVTKSWRYFFFSKLVAIRFLVVRNARRTSC
jgi:hypothetical protein